jgi:hypothetical protein
MRHSQWDTNSFWPYPLPQTEAEVQAFVAKLRKFVIEDEAQQNAVDEACHLIEVLTVRNTGVIAALKEMRDGFSDGGDEAWWYIDRVDQLIETLEKAK